MSGGSYGILGATGPSVGNREMSLLRGDGDLNRVSGLGDGNGGCWEAF